MQSSREDFANWLYAVHMNLIAETWLMVEPDNIELTSIWQHIHTVTTTEVSPDLGELHEILDDVSVEMIPLSYH